MSFESAGSLSFSAWSNIGDLKNNQQSGLSDFARRSVQDGAGNTVTLDTMTGKLLTRNSNGDTVDYEAMLEGDRAETRNATTAGTVFLGSPVLLGMGAAMSAMDGSNDQAQEISRLRGQLDPQARQQINQMTGQIFDQLTGQQIDSRTGLQLDPRVAQQFDPRDAEQAFIQNGRTLSNAQLLDGRFGQPGDARSPQQLDPRSAQQQFDQSARHQETQQKLFNPHDQQQLSQTNQMQAGRAARGYISDAAMLATAQSDKMKISRQDIYSLSGLAPELFANQHMIERNHKLREDDRRKRKKNDLEKMAALEKRRLQMRMKVSLDRSSITSTKLLKRKEQIESELDANRHQTTLAESSRLHSELEVLDKAISRLSALGL